jgi:hypothetical protein
VSGAYLGFAIVEGVYCRGFSVTVCSAGIETIVRAKRVRRHLKPATDDHARYDLFDLANKFLCLGVLDQLL